MGRLLSERWGHTLRGSVGRDPLQAFLHTAMQGRQRALAWLLPREARAGVCEAAAKPGEARAAATVVLANARILPMIGGGEPR